VDIGFTFHAEDFVFGRIYLENLNNAGIRKQFLNFHLLTNFDLLPVINSVSVACAFIQNLLEALAFVFRLENLLLSEDLFRGFLENFG
jgi:hypothetical protein